MKSAHIGRWLLSEEGLVDGSIRIEGDHLAEVCYGVPPGGSTKSLILPGLVNAHTHIGDSFAFPAPKGTLEETVGPPDGYKHRILRTVSREKMVAGMVSSLEIMRRSGTSTFIDFREGGLLGIDELKEAISGGRGMPRAVVLGRPVSSSPNSAELSEILRASDGFGLSAMRDLSPDLLLRASSAARSAGKRFAFHASESQREDIDKLLKLRPDFVVHMAGATDDDLTACAAAGIPVVVCPRSNMFFGIKVDIPRMLRAGLVVALGTDNGMIASPDMFEEMRAAYGSGRKAGLTPLDVVGMAALGGRKVLSAPAIITPEIGARDDLAIVRVRGDDPLLEMCSTAGPDNVEAVVRGGKVWRSEAWR